MHIRTCENMILFALTEQEESLSTLANQIFVEDKENWSSQANWSYQDSERMALILDMNRGNTTLLF